MPIEIDIKPATGGERVLTALLQRAAQGLYEEAGAIIADAQEHYVPIDQGVLKASGFVELPRTRDGQISTRLGFGGPASAYARVQHENLTFHHTVGGAKYLERPALAAVRGMATRLRAFMTRRA